MESIKRGRAAGGGAGRSGAWDKLTETTQRPELSKPVRGEPVTFGSSNHRIILPAARGSVHETKVTFALVLLYWSREPSNSQVRNIFQGVVEAVGEIRHADHESEFNDLSFVVILA